MPAYDLERRVCQPARLSQAIPSRQRARMFRVIRARYALRVRATGANIEWEVCSPRLYNRWNSQPSKLFVVNRNEIEA